MKSKTPGGEHPNSVRFSPNGEKIAVGFNDTTNVNVLSSRDLSLLYAPNTATISKGNLAYVAWSVDGCTIYAGGSSKIKWSDRKWQQIIYSWSEEGRGAQLYLKSGVLNTIMGIAPLPDGSIAYGSQDPSIGVLDRDGNLQQLAGSVNADFRGNLEGFKIASDGTKVRFCFWQYGNCHQRSP
jgi:WD40 repeat protein